MAITILPVDPRSPAFKDALYVRFNVFVHEQQIPAEIEIDDDDDRCLHWVAYTDDPTPKDRSETDPKLAPVGTCRIVPAKKGTGERFIHLGRMAVVKEYRKMGISRMMMDIALGYAVEHPEEVVPESEGGFDGRVNIGAQVPAMPAWSKLGFVRDWSVEEWDEGGIPHGSMWKTVEISKKD